VVYRIHFSHEDLARVRVVDRPPPLGETILAVMGIQQVHLPIHFTNWRGQVLGRLPRQARMVFDLASAGGYTPRFLLPNRSANLSEELEYVRSTPRGVIHREMTRYAERRPLPGWARGLDDDPQMLQRLVDVLGRVHATMVAPYSSQVDARVTADKAARARDLLDGGVHRLLNRLHPSRVRWKPPVLEVATVCGLRGDLYLNGRGLLLVPSVFGFVAPAVDPDADPQPCLAYPVRYDETVFPVSAVDDSAGTGRPSKQVVALLGRTRAAILHTIAERPGCTTSELAAVMGVSISSASQHATVLRDAGLIATTRHRQAARHAPTRTGIALLNAATADYPV